MTIPGQWVPTIGEPFQAVQLSNGAGGTVTVSINITDGVGRFGLTIVNTGTAIARLVMYTPNAQFDAPPGTTNVPLPTARWGTATFSVVGSG